MPNISHEVNMKLVDQIATISKNYRNIATKEWRDAYAKDDHINDYTGLEVFYNIIPENMKFGCENNEGADGLYNCVRNTFGGRVYPWTDNQGQTLKIGVDGISADICADLSQYKWKKVDGFVGITEEGQCICSVESCYFEAEFAPKRELTVTDISIIAGVVLFLVCICGFLLPILTFICYVIVYIISAIAAPFVAIYYILKYTGIFLFKAVDCSIFLLCCAYEFIRDYLKKRKKDKLAENKKAKGKKQTQKDIINAKAEKAVREFQKSGFIRPEKNKKSSVSAYKKRKRSTKKTQTVSQKAKQNAVWATDSMNPQPSFVQLQTAPQQPVINAENIQTETQKQEQEHSLEFDIERDLKRPQGIKFDYDMVNCNDDLKALVEKLKKSEKRAYTILLYGVSGSGKSYFGQYLAQELGLPYIKKKVSDLQDKYIGETEKKICYAFEEARKAGAVLILDEADSFLFDRRFAQRDFECTNVNELLVQLEEHNLPVILTSNLKDKLDKAVFRRILFKIKYDYMKPKNIQAGVKNYFGEEYKLSKKQLNELKYISAGDFPIAKQKADILDDGKYTNELIYEYLLKEQEEKLTDIEEKKKLENNPTGFALPQINQEEEEEGDSEKDFLSKEFWQNIQFDDFEDIEYIPLDIRDKYGRTPLMFAAKYSDDPDILRSLVYDYEADTEERDNYGKTVTKYLLENKEMDETYKKDLQNEFSVIHRDVTRTATSDDIANRTMKNMKIRREDENGLKMQMDKYGKAFVETESNWTRTEKEYNTDDEYLGDTYGDFDFDD